MVVHQNHKKNLKNHIFSSKKQFEKEKVTTMLNGQVYNNKIN
jgi:hypothetical protein